MHQTLIIPKGHKGPDVNIQTSPGALKQTQKQRCMFQILALQMVSSKAREQR